MRALVAALVVLMVPAVSFAGGGGHGHDRGKEHHRRGWGHDRDHDGGRGHHHDNRCRSNERDGFYTVWDDFRNGFTIDAPDAKWFHFNAGPFVANDGVVKTSHKGLEVKAAGKNPKNHDPAFTLTVAPEGLSGLPGGLDHPKWLVYMNHLASSGVPGHDAVRGETLSCEVWMSGRTYNTKNHPFGRDVKDQNDDLRLASFAINTVDFESFMVFDFFITNETIYAFYERLPFGREALGNYASFSHQIPVAKRGKGQEHHLKISYDRAAGRVMWFIDGEEVFRVNKIGHRLDRRWLTLDHGGEEEIVDMKQLSCGMGMFTLLDAQRPGQRGLVRLSEVPGTYYSPDLGEPAEQSFVDNASLESSRLFGQGASIKVRKYAVSSKPNARH